MDMSLEPENDDDLHLQPKMKKMIIYTNLWKL